MFAYLIIGVELAILYLVFWAVFIREPKPREIRAELWGHYDDWQKFSKSNKSELDSSDSAAPVLPSRVRTRPNRVAYLRALRHRYYSRHHCFCKCHKTQMRVNNRYQARAVLIPENELNRVLAEKFLFLLNKTLNKFSVKIPY